MGSRSGWCPVGLVSLCSWQPMDRQGALPGSCLWVWQLPAGWGLAGQPWQRSTWAPSLSPGCFGVCVGQRSSACHGLVLGHQTRSASSDSGSPWTPGRRCCSLKCSTPCTQRFLRRSAGSLAFGAEPSTPFNRWHCQGVLPCPLLHVARHPFCCRAGHSAGPPPRDVPWTPAEPPAG